MIKMCDDDGDGQVSFEEFSSMVFEHTSRPKIEKAKMLKPGDVDSESEIKTAMPGKDFLAITITLAITIVSPPLPSPSPSSPIKWPNQHQLVTMTTIQMWLW